MLVSVFLHCSYRFFPEIINIKSYILTTHLPLPYMLSKGKLEIGHFSGLNGERDWQVLDAEDWARANKHKNIVKLLQVRCTKLKLKFLKINRLDSWFIYCWIFVWLVVFTECRDVDTVLTNTDVFVVVVVYLFVFSLKKKKEKKNVLVNFNWLINFFNRFNQIGCSWNGLSQ